jgi:uncharacterized membrane protein
MRPLSFAGVIVAGVVAPLATMPSLVPRAAVIQGLLLALLAGVGYATGAGVGWLIRRLRQQPQWRAPVIARRIGVAVALLWLLAWLWLGRFWQQELTQLIGIESPGASWMLVSALVATLLCLLLLLIGRGVRRLFLGLDRWLATKVNGVAAHWITAAVAILLVIPLVNGWALTGVVAAFNPLFQQMNAAGTDEPTPSLTTVSGGPDSDITWADLGADGRQFAGNTPTPDQINEFSGGGAVDPIRVFVGFDSAPTPEQRADLALTELQRFGAFDRDVLAVGTSTGTGTVDESAVQPLEYMYNGNTATVATQYSILPSFLSFLLDQQAAQDEAIALFRTVHDYWSTLPVDDRPQLVIFGESLGAFGATAPFSDLDQLTAEVDGALLAGPPNGTQLWSRYTDEREPNSPEVQPVYDNGEQLRWANTPTALDEPTTRWSSPRVAYLQNASDPVVWWAPELLWSQPDWLAEPRGPGVLPQLSWLPLITFVGVSGDMIDSQSVPAGFGHVYGYTEAAGWARVLPPPGWTAADTAALIERFGG